jgi:hypothetical protein
MIPGRKDLGLEKSEVLYAAGQPMGALSSWALLALTHHCIVQWAWYRVCNRSQEDWTWYEDYAVLGDDVVILGRSVAKEYVILMEALGVAIGMHKSLISVNGDGLEFAKRTLYKGQDVSAVPFKECMVAKANLPSLLELVRRYNLSLGAMMSFLGYGYVARSRLSNRLWSLPVRMRNYIVAYYSPAMPGFPGLERWLSLRSVGNFYSASEARTRRLMDKILGNERDALLKILERYAPLFAEAKRLATVYRDREHYGTVARGVDRTYFHAGVSLDVSQQIVDSLNETVYREAFLDVAAEARELRAKVEGIQVSSETDLESLWASVREIELQLSALPLPRALVISSGLAPLGKSSDLRRWKLYSSIFRSTVS